MSISAEQEKLIQNIITLRIAPVLQAHGGDIAFKEIKDDIVYVEMQGACDGCPNAINTLKNNVEAFLMAIFPEIRSVQDINIGKSDSQQQETEK